MSTDARLSTALGPDLSRMAAWSLGRIRRLRGLWACLLAALAATALPALGATYHYVDWTSANLAQGTAAGTIALPNGSTVGVTFKVVNQDGTPGQIHGVQTSGGTNYWVPSGTYTGAVVSNAPASTDIVQLVGSPGQTYVITLSKVVKNPIMAIASLGAPGTPVLYKFTAFAPFTILSQGPGYWGSGSLSAPTGTALVGEEGSGTIQFTGDLATFGWTASAQETWHGFTVGIRGDDAPPPATPPDVQTAPATGITASGATLNGTVSSNGAATAVTFEYGLTAGGGAFLATATPSPLAAGATSAPVSATISDLLCNAEYYFSVTGSNSAGTTSGIDRMFTTAACGGSGSPPGAPTGVVATAGNTQATVSFIAPLSDGGSPITGYTVTSSPAGGVDSAAGTTATTRTITGLINGLAYTFTVVATNAFGPGAASAPSNSVIPTAGPTPAFDGNVQGLWWRSPAGSESGWGINFAHQGTVIFATWFTYDDAGKPWWLIAELHRSAAGIYSGPVSTVTGPPFDAVPFEPGNVSESFVGSMTVNFTGANDGVLSYTVNGISQTKPITRQVFGTLPSCVWGAQANLALATNYQDLWWKFPAGSESGWGINFTHQGDIIFATWFTYDASGKPWWLIAELLKGAAGVYSGPVSTVTGPPFNAVPFNPGNVVETVVGSATVTFADGNRASFAYLVNGVAQTKSITRQVFVPPGTVCQ